MAEALLSLRCTRSGVMYVDDGLMADDWDNTSLLDGVRGVLVLGTDDTARARPVADEATRRFFGPGVAARNPAPGRWGLFCTSENRDELEWRHDEDGGDAVLFTAEEADRG